MSSYQSPESYSEIFEVLSELRLEGAVPVPGLRGSLFRAVDELRDRGADAGHRAIAEQVAVALRRLDEALALDDPQIAGRCREAFRALADQWMNTPAPRR